MSLSRQHHQSSSDHRRRPALLDGALLAVASGSSVLSLALVNLWYVLPGMAAAFLAGRRMERVRPALWALVAVLTAGVLAVLVVPEWITQGTAFVSLLVCAGMGPWLVGRFWRQSQELVRAGWERAERLEREQRLVAEQARLRERARIAQDMHDALGHDLSLIALRAGALKLAPGLAAPHRDEIGEIRAGAAAAVERLGEVIGILRDEADEAAALGPADAGIPQLVGKAAAAGLDVRLTVVGEPDGLPRAAEYAAYRVVQEALTNAAKHAPQAAVTVEVAYRADGARVRVANGPSPAPAAPMPSGTGGRGLLGLAERVRLAGGSFTHGRGPDGEGFEVQAVLPRGGQAGRHAVADPEAGLPRAGGAAGLRIPGTRESAARMPVAERELRRARRRVGRMLAAVVLVPLATGLVLTVALRGWTTYAAGRAVLDPADYASLRVGQDRASVQRVLPEHRFPYRPPAKYPSPQGEGVTCEYYAMTADSWNDDRSGDAYRLCFQGGVLISLDALIA